MTNAVQSRLFAVIGGDLYPAAACSQHMWRTGRVDPHELLDATALRTGQSHLSTWLRHHGDVRTVPWTDAALGYGKASRSEYRAIFEVV